MTGYLQSLIRTESGGNWGAKNNEMGAGGKAGHFGRVQFGQARLQDAMNAGAIPQGTTPQQFMASPDLQVAAEKWHFADLENKLGPLVGSVVNGKPLDMGALVAMGHLGGAGGARKFVETGGKYNPSDSFGTSLSDYASTHGNQGIARDVMSAIGKSPTSSTTSTMNGADPMADTGGLLGQFKRTDENVGGLLGMLFKGMTPDRADSIRAAIGGLQGIDNQGMVSGANGRMQARRQAEAGDLQYQRGLEAEQRGYDRQDAVSAREQAQADQQRQQARAWIAANSPDQLAAFDAGMVDQGGVYKAAKGGGDNEYGLTPQYVTNPDGTLGMVQLSKNGPPKVVELPEGLALQKGVEKLDLGTTYQWYNTVTGDPIGAPIPKQLAGAAAETAKGTVTGKAEGEAQASASGVIAESKVLEDLIDSVISDPALDSVVGNYQGRLPAGTPLNGGQAGANVQTKIDQIGGKAFLQSFESLKGGGSITEREGQAAQAAIARMNQTQDEATFRESLSALKQIATNARLRAEGKQVQEYAGDSATATASTAAPIRKKFNPATGKIE